MISSREYWAAVSSDEIGREVQGKVDRYYAYLTSSSLVDLWRKSFYAYYGLQAETAVQGFGLFAIGSLMAKGSEGEIAGVKVNHFRNLITHQHSLTTQQRPALECRAINSDSKSLAQAWLGDGILEYYMKEKGIEREPIDACEMALVLGEAFNRFDWDATAGKEYGKGPNGAPVYDGDLVCRTYNPFDVVRDTTAPSAKDLSWYIFHDVKNKYDLAVRYPSAAEKILSTSQDIVTARRFIDPTKIIPAAGIGSRDTELVDIYELIHKPTDALPQGRYSIVLTGGTALFDGPLPFRRMPVTRMAAGEVIGSPFGWTLAFDLLGLQELVDKLYTVIASNQMAAGIQNFWQPPGNELTKTQLGGGLNLLESVVKPEVLQLLHTPAEIFQFAKMVEQVMEVLSGVSAVNRGATPENLKSGSALAFVAAQAITFSNNLQRSYNQVLESAGNIMVEILKDFAVTPRMASIVGQFGRSIMREFVGNDLSQIDRVIVEVTNPASKTISGRIQIAQDMLQAGLIRNPKEYLTVINTGQLESMYEGEMSQILCAHAENEDLRMGKYPIAMITDDPILHCLEHRALIDNPDSRRDPEFIGSNGSDGSPRSGVLGHIQDHIDVAAKRTPELMALFRMEPLPAPQPPQPGPGPAGMPQQMNPQAPMVQQAEGIKGPNMPNLPKNAPQQAQEAYAQLKGNLQQ